MAWIGGWAVGKVARQGCSQCDGNEGKGQVAVFVDGFGFKSPCGSTKETRTRGDQTRGKRQPKQGLNGQPDSG